MKKKLFLVLSLVCLFFFFRVPLSFADSNFSTDYNVTYTIGANAQTHVNLNVVITNLSNVYFTPSYQIQMGFENITGLSAYDESGSVRTSTKTDSKGTTINVNFNQRVVGIGQKHTLDISFDTNEVAQNLNHVWEINIPGLSNTSDFNTFNTVVIYPDSLGKPAFIKPAVYPVSSVSGNELVFNKQQLGTSGISITFGQYQIYGFDLIYHLGNSNLFPISTEIALPLSTNYQDVLIDSITPKPVNVKLDGDGNWLATYYLSPSQDLDIEVKGKAKVSLSPKPEGLPNDQVQNYLKPLPYWQSNDPKIKNLANQLKTPEAIYNYVSGNLSYDYARAATDNQRLGAVGVLSSPDSAVCLEFTDLFIALARAAGIPAREVDGYAYTQNTQERPLSLVKDILHAWPEYYDFQKNTWVMVDPTWGNTTGGVDYFHTLDFDHFAFVVKGLNSSYPVPAGGYKLPQNVNSKDVNVRIANNFNPEVSLNPEISIPDTVFSGFPVDTTINIKNTGNTISSTQGITVNTGFLNPKNQTVYFQKIPPFGYAQIPITFTDTSFLTNTGDTVKITLGNNTYSKNIKILPIFFYKWVLLGIGGVIFVIFGIVLSVIIRKSRRVSVPQQ